ncbi:MAG: hypothetical protein R2800_07830 [Flavipsychrobacter sp.]
MLKKIIIVLLLLAVVGGGVAYFMWNKPHQKAEDIKGIEVTVSQVANDFSTDQKKAEAKYLDKVIEVAGTVNEVNQNQDGQLLVILGGEDPTASVQCSMRDKGVAVKEGDKITVKGFCAGLSLFEDVMLTDCVLAQ